MFAFYYRLKWAAVNIYEQEPESYPSLCTACRSDATLRLYICCDSTCISQEFGGFQNFLSVNTGLVVVHLGGDDVDDAGGSSADGAGRAVQPVHIPLLQGDHALIHVLQDVVLWNTRKETDLSVHREQNDISKLHNTPPVKKHTRKYGSNHTKKWGYNVNK